MAKRSPRRAQVFRAFSCGVVTAAYLPRLANARSHRPERAQRAAVRCTAMFAMPVDGYLAQHRLYFRPLPHGHGPFRLGPAAGIWCRRPLSN
jgi:hypothetical protein